MKTTLSILFLAALMLLCGCGQKPDANAVRYADRITALESNITELYQRNENRKTMERSLLDLATNQMDLVKSNSFAIPVLQLESFYHQLQIEALQTAVSNFTKTPVRAGTVSTRATTSPGVMPPAVAAQIRADAERKWGSKYDMQVYEIKNQTEAWYKLHP